MDGKPVAGYFRISQSRDEMNAPTLYQEQIEHYCVYRGLRLAEVFSDIDYSGYTNSENRPALKELVRRRREFSAVVIPKLSRFGRSLKHLTRLFDLFDTDHISLVFLDLGMDTSTSQGRLLRNVMGAFAEYESDVRSDYTKANVRYAIEQGRPYGGPAPYGYTRRDKSYEPDPQRAEVVRFIFKRFGEGVSQFGIARELAARGIPSAGKAVWEANKIGRLLDNSAYAALMSLDGQFVPGNWKPLIEPDEWHRIADLRKQTREKWSRPRGAKRLLAGLVYCGDCGRHAYYTARGDGLPGRYKCGRSDTIRICHSGGVNARKAEEYVTTAFLERARYYLMRGETKSFIADKQWELADVQERRMLLTAAIDRVVILPLEPRRTHSGPGGRALHVDWKAEPETVEAPPVSKGIKRTGRAAVLARDQLREIEAKKAVQAESARVYFREWKAWQAAKREEWWESHMGRIESRHS